MVEDIKQYTKNAQLGNKGEAFFESLVSDYCLPHRIVAPKDLGVDFICEWVYGEKPTGILFAVQVKTVTAQAEKTGTDKDKNGLDEFKISNSTLTIDPKTLNYWKRLGLPTYLFAILSENEVLNCFYRRFTTVLTLEKEQQKQPFYKVNNNNKFIAFLDDENKTHGFARDLYIDYMRCNYNKGSIAYLNPRNIGLNQFLDEENGGVIFGTLFDDYKDKICATYKKVETYLNKNC